MHPSVMKTVSGHHQLCRAKVIQAIKTLKLFSFQMWKKQETILVFSLSYSVASFKKII